MSSSDICDTRAGVHCQPKASRALSVEDQGCLGWWCRRPLPLSDLRAENPCCPWMLLYGWKTNFWCVSHLESGACLLPRPAHASPDNTRGLSAPLGEARPPTTFLVSLERRPENTYQHVTRVVFSLAFFFHLVYLGDTSTSAYKYLPYSF